MSDKLTALEILQNSRYNFNNVIKASPEMVKNPIFQIAKSQLDNGVRKLEKEFDDYDDE